MVTNGNKGKRMKQLLESVSLPLNVNILELALISSCIASQINKPMPELDKLLDLNGVNRKDLEKDIATKMQILNETLISSLKGK